MSLLALQELIVCVVFVAVVVKSFPRMYEENAVEEDNDADIIAYSYHHFVRPVTSYHEEIIWEDKYGHHHYDYKANPKYKYSYGVDDYYTNDHHGQTKHRDCKHVQDEYHIHEPGGNVRSVKYHADPHGRFYAEVYNYCGNDHSSGTYGGYKHR
ncbi:Cuticle protein [Trachymyrmex cornetzi]|uniref:Cuticle protein n=1 Tax=Trachymyrmex cornetzi TaxID=471704 RepID=A0A195E252_9HYME|nr:Cuticle protein [Trachymyrmex cornetzi]